MKNKTKKTVRLKIAQGSVLLGEPIKVRAIAKETGVKLRKV